jgi:hypothetical protein
VIDQDSGDHFTNLRIMWSIIHILSIFNDSLSFSRSPLNLTIESNDTVTSRNPKDKLWSRNNAVMHHQIGLCISPTGFILLRGFPWRERGWRFGGDGGVETASRLASGGLGGTLIDLETGGWVRGLGWT